MGTTNARHDPYAAIAERFKSETEHHQMTVLLDQGLHRHLHFQQPGRSMYWFDLITVPGALIFQGDGDSFVFRRDSDMFAFFRSNPDRGAIGINPDYWSEKLTSGRDAVKAYSREKFELAVTEALQDAEQDRPGVTAAWNTAADDGLDYDLDHEESARQALRGFEFCAKTVATCPCGGRVVVDAGDLVPAEWRDEHPRGLGHPYQMDRVPGFRFQDTWEWDLKDFEPWFLWACHAIVAGIAMYDAARAQTPARETAVAA